MGSIMHEEGKQALLLPVAQSSRRAFCRSIPQFAALLLFPLAEGFVGCNEKPKKRILRPTVQINTTDVITNTRYIGEAFELPERMVFASLVPPLNRPPFYTPGISFLGIIAQDTLSSGCDSITPCDILRVGLFRQKNDTFRYGYEINGVRHYATGHALSSDYKYNINFQLQQEGEVTDPEYPHERRFGYDFQISRGWDGSTLIKGLQSAPVYAGQIFVGVMDENNAVHLPDNKQLQFYISPSGSEQIPDVIYKNDDETSQVSSQFSDSENRIILTLTGSY
jgi:hypothetical protein